MKEGPIITNTILLRTLTLKSRVDFGINNHLRIEELLQLEGKASLVWMYYNLSKITFDKSIMDSLGLTKEELIDKPGKNIELGETVIKRFEAEDSKRAYIPKLDNAYNNKPQES